ncbi:MAG: hypothetical protein J4432_00200 [DPANN group archaeon]|nr:hypothetical protein [DPANN group archaeon]
MMGLSISAKQELAALELTEKSPNEAALAIGLVDFQSSKIRKFTKVARRKLAEEFELDPNRSAIFREFNLE